MLICLPPTGMKRNPHMRLSFFLPASKLDEELIFSLTNNNGFFWLTLNEEPVVNDKAIQFSI
jgi:hypothetical protein